MTGAGSSTSSAEEEEGEEEEKEEEGVMEGDQEITEYERLRLETIKQNEEVLASLQLKGLATSLENSVATPLVVPGRKKKNISLAVLESRRGERRRSQRLSSMQTAKIVDWGSDSSEAAASESDGPKSSGKAKERTKKKKMKSISLAKLDDIEEKKKEDVEYEPSDSSDSDEDEEDESEIEPEKDVTRKRHPSRNQTTPVKRPRSRTLKSPVKRTISLNSPELFQKSPTELPIPVDLDQDGDNDLALQQALALSMGSTADVMAPTSSGRTRGKPPHQSPQDHIGFNSASTRRNKRSNSLMYEENEIDAFFVSIVGNKEGRLSKRHLEKAASAHDFIWKEEEINDMIDMFHADGDGQLNLAAFRSMAKRTKLMETC